MKYMMFCLLNTMVEERAAQQCRRRNSYKFRCATACVGFSSDVPAHLPAICPKSKGLDPCKPNRPHTSTQAVRAGAWLVAGRRSSTNPQGLHATLAQSLQRQLHQRCCTGPLCCDGRGGTPALSPGAARVDAQGSWCRCRPVHVPANGQPQWLLIGCNAFMPRPDAHFIEWKESISLLHKRHGLRSSYAQRQSPHPRAFATELRSICSARSCFTDGMASARALQTAWPTLLHQKAWQTLLHKQHGLWLSYALQTGLLCRRHGWQFSAAQPSFAAQTARL